jgi:D-alanyl-D-alanine carboxypeptidase
MPGALAEARDGRSTITAASGVADVDTGRKMKPTFQHRMGSITKTFTATIVLQLVAEGKIRLDAPVSAYLPRYGTTGITVRMLLNHTSGIGDFDTVLFQTGDDLERYRYTTFTPDQLARLGLNEPRTNPPGGPWAYSNTNYVLAGLIIEKVTGRPLAFDMYLRIILPLGLWRTYPAGSTTTIAGPHSKGYIPWYDGKLRDFSVYNMSWGWALGDLVSTSHDLNVFFRALFTGKLLRPAELAQMKTTVPLVPEFPELGGYGLGLLTVPFPCGDIWGHDGLVLGHSAISLHSANADRQVTLGVNMTHYADPSQPDPISDALSQLLLTSLCPGTATAKQAFTWRSPLHPANALTR